MLREKASAEVACTGTDTVDVSEAAAEGRASTAGLGLDEVLARRATHGWNKLPEKAPDPLWRELLEALAEPLQLLLVAVGVLYAVFGELRDALVILAVIVTVAFVESATEWRAGRAIRALGELAAPRAVVRRGGVVSEVAPAELVPGDVLLLTAGSRVPADVRLTETEGVAVDESLVTGESQPVVHNQGAGSDELMAGTHVVRGNAIAVVTRTGADSTLGRIASLVAQEPEPRTPLQRQLGQLAKVLLVAAIAVSAIVPAIGVLAGEPLKDMVLTGLTLAFATIPEELPILVVVVLGLGSLALARQGAIVRRLIAAETLGAVTVVCTDKTGTLTENRMAVERVIPAAELSGEAATGDAGRQVVEFARLASEPPSIDDSRFIDPVDTAIWQAADTAVVPGEVRRYGFDDRLRLASTAFRVADRWMLATKGAPEAIVDRTVASRRNGGASPIDDAWRRRVLSAAEMAAEAGQRVLAVASRQIADGAGEREALESDLVFEGLLVLSDPIRKGVPEAVAELQGAGVSVSMVTGDQAATAVAVARQIGLGGRALSAAEMGEITDSELARIAGDGAVFTRTRPEDKLRIARALEAAGEVVAMTGDGVNDAPALKAAAIGVAMGRGGSDVARETADLILTDDNFTTLARAVGQGRRLFENLRKAVRYYLAVKVALVTVSFIAAVAGLPLPFAPVQIVILELFMDLGASVAFVNLPAEADEMKRPPRDPRAPFLDRRMAAGIFAGGLTLAAATGAAYLIGLRSGGVKSGRTLAMATWMTCHAVLGVIMGWERRPVALQDLAANPAMVGWVTAALLFAGALLTVAPLQLAMHAGVVDARSGVIAIFIAIVAPLWMEALKHVRRRAPGGA
jgi:P-type Ca2+ transporter type 2C